MAKSKEDESSETNFTPMVEQYLSIKKQYGDILIFFRIGDFYEMFLEDAELASKELQLFLTAKACGNGKKIPMCGIPHRAYLSYAQKLIDRGYKVAICEQVEDPKTTLAVNIKISNNSNSDMTINNIYIYSESTKSKIKTYTISDDPTITSNNNKTYELDFDGTSIFPIDIHLTYTIDGNNYDSIVKYNSQFEDVTAINNIVNGESTTDRIYSIDGKRLTTPIKGINILKMSDGTTK
jgi:hypothetical protein